eukprot:252723_1
MASFVLYIAWMTSSLAIASNTETNSLSCYAPRVPTELSHIEGRLGLIGSPIAQFDASSFMITQITQNSNYNPHYLFTQTPQFLKPVENEVHVDTLLNSSAPLWKGNPSIAQSASVSQLISTTVLFAHEHNNEGRDTFKWVPHCDGLDHTMQATNHATEQNHAFTTTTLPTLDYTTNNKHEHALIHVPNQATIAFPHDPVRSRFFEMIAFPGDYIDTSRSADDGGVHLSQPNTCMHESSNACKLMNCGLHHHRMDEAINAFNTTSSPPHGFPVISTSVLVTHGHNEGRHTFANNNIPGQQTEARMTG